MYRHNARDNHAIASWAQLPGNYVIQLRSRDREIVAKIFDEDIAIFDRAVNANSFNDIMVSVLTLGVNLNGI